MKFTPISNFTYHQVIAGAEIVGTFFGPSGLYDAYQKAEEITATGNNVVIYSFTHESVNVGQ